jgi:hypothetical protein
MVPPIHLAFIQDPPKRAVAGGKGRARNAFDELVAPHPEVDEGLDGQAHQVMALGKGLKVCQTRNLPRVRQDGAEDRAWVEPRQPTEIEGSLCLPCPRQDPPFHGAEGKDVTGSDQVLGPGLGIDQRLNGDGPVKGRDAGRRSRPGIH